MDGTELMRKCPQCKGNGVQMEEVPVDHPRLGGKFSGFRLVPSICPNCVGLILRLASKHLGLKIVEKPEAAPPKGDEP